MTFSEHGSMDLKGAICRHFQQHWAPHGLSARAEVLALIVLTGRFRLKPNIVAGSALSIFFDVVYADGKRLSSKRSCKFVEVSALLDHRVDDLLVTVIRLARRHRPSSRTSDPRRPDDDDDDDGQLQQSCFQRAATFAFCRKLFK